MSATICRLRPIRMIDSLVIYATAFCFNLYQNRSPNPLLQDSSQRGIDLAYLFPAKD